MRIDFFEEFPNNENLDKSKLISFNTTIYVAAKSIQDFYKLEKEINKINSSLEVAYWPILKKSYWISPFSYPEELLNLIREFKQNKYKKPLKVLIDLELPLNKKLIKKNLRFYYKNKKIIKYLFKNQKKLNIEISTAECALISRFDQKKMEIQGISYSLKKFKYKKVVMFYPSMVKRKKIVTRIQKYLIKKLKKFKDNLNVALGTIAFGVRGTEPILTPEYFEKYLDFLNRIGIKRVIVFRLGGLNKEYLKVIDKYLD